jgi:hypothetical protein
MEQTAVEWLVEQLFKTNNNTTDSKKMDSESIIQQAKEMEKQQIIEAYDEAEGKIIGKGEQYYTETFKK